MPFGAWRTSIPSDAGLSRHDGCHSKGHRTTKDVELDAAFGGLTVINNSPIPVHEVHLFTSNAKPYVLATDLPKKGHSHQLASTKLAVAIDTFLSKAPENTITIHLVPTRPKKTDTSDAFFCKLRDLWTVDAATANHPDRPLPWAPVKNTPASVGFLRKQAVLSALQGWHGLFTSKDPKVMSASFLHLKKV